MQANFAVNNELINDFFPFSLLSDQSANTLIFPNLSAGNIAYKLVKEMGDREAIGPSITWHEKTSSCSSNRFFSKRDIKYDYSRSSRCTKP